MSVLLMILFGSASQTANEGAAEVFSKQSWPNVLSVGYMLAFNMYQVINIDRLA